jgi:hypothetical protein
MMPAAHASHFSCCRWIWSVVRRNLRMIATAPPTTAAGAKIVTT